MNYGDIKAYVRTQTHRPDTVLTDALFDEWLDVVQARLIRDVQFTTQITETTYTPTTNPDTLPTDVDELLEVWTVDNGYNCKVQATSREQFRTYSNGTGASLFYTVQGASIEFAPDGTNREFTLRYRAKLTSMTGDADENQLAAEHPQMLIYGLLRECYWYLRDFEAVQAVQETYNSEAEAIRTRSAFIQTGDNPQMSGASEWHQ